MPHIAHTRYALWAVAGLAALRVAIPLAALAASGHALPGMPEYAYVGLTGDATGFYAAAREFMASWDRVSLLIVAALAVASIAVAVMAWKTWRERPAWRPWVIVGLATWISGVAAIGISQMNPPGAAVVGWPLVWSVPMLPYRALGFPLDQDIAFGFGLVLSLAANAATVVATSYAALYATRRRGVAVLAAALVALWPLLVGVIGGERAWENGTWTVDAGLAMYTEPLSTALVTITLALLLSPRANETTHALAGAALGLAAVVKLSNGLLAFGALAVLVVYVGFRRALPFAAAAAAFVPIFAVYWPKGYPAVLDEDPDLWPDEPFALDYIVSNWTDSLLFTPRVLLLIVPMAVVGAIALSSAWPRRLLVLWALVNPIVYSPYFVTSQHPRSLFASLPAMFVLWALGAATIATAARRTRTRSNRPPGHAGSP